MANEADGRRALVRVLTKRLGLHAHAIEAGDTCPGFPDVEYCGTEVSQGVLEVKRLPDWPRRATTPVRLPKGYLKRAQVAFMRRRVEAGGNAGLALQIGGRDWYLLHPRDVLAAYDRAEQAIAWDQAWLRSGGAWPLSSPQGLNAALVEAALRDLATGLRPEARADVVG